MSNMTVAVLENTQPSIGGAEVSQPRRRILIATDTYPPDVNGAGHFTYRLATGLAERGHEVHVVCASDIGDSHRHTMDGVMMHRLRSWPVMLYPSLRFVMPGSVNRAAQRIIQEVQPDVVHLQSHFGVGRACLRAAQTCNIPVVATNHFMPEPLLRHVSIPQWWRNRAATWAWRDAARVFSRANYVTTPTPLAAETFVDRGFTGHIEAVSCGIDLSRFHPRLDTVGSAREYFGLPDRETVLFVGRLDDEKRIDQLIRALAMLRRRRDVQLVVAGVGSKAEHLKAVAADTGVAPHLHMLGYVTEEDLPRVYHTADVFAIASVAELQSIVTLEAMASGLPVVGADAVALPHLVHNGRNGYLFMPGDVEGLAARLEAVLARPDAREAMGSESLSLAAQHEHSRSLARFEEIYDRQPIPLRAAA